MLNKRGFTLIELMVALFVLAILLMIAVPAFDSQMRNNRALALGENFANALNYARSEAVKRGSPVVLCASNAAQTTCGSDWSDGWLVIEDTAAATASSTTVTAGSALQVWQAPEGGAVVAVQRTASGSTNDTTFIRYTGIGTLAPIGNAANTARVTTHVADCNGEVQQQIDVTVAGALRVSRTDCPS